jgi:hypothetical protein
MTHAGRLAALALMSAAIFALLLPSATAGFVVPAAHSGIGPLVTPTAPVFIHFKPKSVTGTQGGGVTVHALVNNSGAHTFDALSCNLWYRLGSSGAWTKAGVCLSSSAFPHAFPAHTVSNFTVSQHVSMTFPTGLYEWKIQLLGTYHGTAEKSHPGTIKVTIT